MVRQAFVPPDEDEDDVLSFLATGTQPAAEPTGNEAPIARRQRKPRKQPVSTRKLGLRPARPGSKDGAHLKPVAKAALGGLKRIGIYCNTQAWEELKLVGLERAREGQPHDYTTIVLEALAAAYPGRKWGL